MRQSAYLVTGGAGFIGANFVHHALAARPDWRVINLDLMTYAASAENLMGMDAARHTLVQGDIGDRALVERLFAEHDIRGVVHFAAESHVDNSLSGPEVFFRTNVLGTLTLLDVARQAWLVAPGQVKPGYEDCRFHHISTDEVYGTLGATGAFTEQTPYAPNSPYSASKAGSDFAVRSYFHSYGLNVVTTNCSNNYGPRQHSEKLIPTVIRKALAGEPIPIYGAGTNVRDWLFVDDHCSGILAVLERGRAGETYNLGGGNEQNNLTLAQTICGLLDELHPAGRQGGESYAGLISFVADRPGHDFRYAIDAGKIKRELGWQAATKLPEGLRRTVGWYLRKEGLGVGD